jgi:hypothetical protein
MQNHRRIDEWFEGEGFTSVSERERREADLFFADLVGQPIARQLPQRRAPEAIESAEADTIDIAITVRGMFGGDLSGTVTVKPKDSSTVLATQTIAAGDDDATVTVEKRDAYDIDFKPSATAPDDRYRKTSKEYKPKAPYTSNAVTVKLAVNRWNAKNVYDTWTANNIDTAKAKLVSKKPLCGHSPNVNKEAEAKLEAANKAYLALSSTLQTEIKDSLKIVGGYAFRTQTTGAFSNHSLGTAIDVNYNMDVKQNHHFRLSGEKDDPLRAILLFVQDVVRTESTFASFEILEKSTDLVQWDAGAAFNRLFPPYIEALVAHANGTTPTITPAPASTGANMPERARALTVTRADVKSARAKSTDKVEKAKLRLVYNEWRTFQAWLYGADVTNDNGKVLGNMVGMIPMHRKFVELMVNAGWTWGGRWKGSKDYMHFEDTLAYTRLQKAAPAPKAGEDDEDHELEEHDVDD